MVSQRPDRKMFEPECQNIDCPQCLIGKIYFDREIGFYCMLCGHEFSAIDVMVLIEKTALTSPPERKSGMDHKEPVAEIKELPSRKAKTDHISHEAIKSKKSDREVHDS
jgi:hypothetical protein